MSVSDHPSLTLGFPGWSLSKSLSFFTVAVACPFIPVFLHIHDQNTQKEET